MFFRIKQFFMCVVDKCFIRNHKNKQSRKTGIMEIQVSVSGLDDKTK